MGLSAQRQMSFGVSVSYGYWPRGKSEAMSSFTIPAHTSLCQGSRFRAEWVRK